MTDNVMDLLQKNAETPSNNDLSSLAVLAEQQIALETRLADLEGQLKATKEEHRQISENKIPEVMQEIGVEEFTLFDGSKISVKTFTEGSIIKANEQQAFSWLRENEFDSLIKNEIRADFPREQDALAKEAEEYLQKLGLAVERREAVHPGTLKSFVKEQILEGRVFPPELFSIYQGRKAKITKPKT